MNQKLLSSAVFFIAVSASAAPLTFNRMIIEKNMKDTNGLNLIASRSLIHWCQGVRGPAHFLSYSAAQKAETMADGTYTCDGEFVNYPTTSTVDVFSLGTCTAEVPADLLKTCP